MVKVVLAYDETNARWVPTVEGAIDSVEAVHAFTAASITIQMLDEDILHLAKTEKIGDNYKIIPAVRPGSVAMRESGNV